MDFLETDKGKSLLSPRFSKAPYGNVDIFLKSIGSKEYKKIWTLSVDVELVAQSGVLQI